jgi:hypothetical protein
MTDRPASPLGELLDHMGSQPRHVHDLDAELVALRALWSEVRLQGQMRQAEQPVPQDAGPLNASSLVYRAIELMRDTSPGYLQQFLSYVDDLSWLECLATAGTVPEPKRRKAAR